MRDFICVISFIVDPASKKDKTKIGRFKPVQAVHDLVHTDYAYHVTVEWGDFFKRYETD